MVIKMLLLLVLTGNAFARAEFVVTYPKTVPIPRTLQRVTEPLVIEKKEPLIGPILVVQSGRCFVLTGPANSGFETFADDGANLLWISLPALNHP